MTTEERLAAVEQRLAALEKVAGQAQQLMEQYGHLLNNLPARAASGAFKFFGK